MSPAFLGCAEARVQLLKETEEGEHPRSRTGRECCPRKQRNFSVAEGGQLGLVCHVVRRGENENNPLGVERLLRGVITV